MGWIASTRALIEAWYPGQEDGNAIAAVLYGDVNPSGKLPLSFPRTATAIPTARPEQWPGLDGRSIYTEKLNVGYRWYDATHTQPLFPFGFGLSYVQQPAANREPPHQLRAFGRVQLEPGETKPVRLTLEPSSFSLYDTVVKHWNFPTVTTKFWPEHLLATSRCTRASPSGARKPPNEGLP